MIIRQRRFRVLGFERLEERLALAVAVAVDASQTIRQATTDILGVNAAYWDPLVDTPQTVQLAQAAGLTMVRFPGGSASDFWHFTDPTTYSGEGTAANMAELAASLGAATIVTADYGSGSPQEAAALLAYLNGSASNTTVLGEGQQWDTTTNTWIQVNWQTAGYWASLRAATPLAVDDGLNFLRIGRSAPFDVGYFEIGNELYGSWETDYHGQGGDTGAPHDPATYVKFAKQFAAYAAEISPSLSIGVDTGSPTPGDYDNWTTDVLEQCASQGFMPGFLSDHDYMQASGQESDSTLLLDTVSDASTTFDWTTRADDYRQLLTQTLGSAGNSVLLLATEFNSVDTNPGKQSTSLVNGLFIADSLGVLLDSDYSGALVWNLHNGWDTGQNNSTSLYGWREGGDYGLLGAGDVTDPPATGANVPYPSYFAEQLVSKLVSDSDLVVEATSNNQDLSVYAVEQPGGDLGLLVINKSSSVAETAQFSFTGFNPSGAANVWQYGEAQDNAQEASSNGSSALANFSASIASGNGSFADTFPAYSMSVVELAPDSATQLAVFGTPLSVADGSQFALTVIAEDALGNPLSGFAGAISLALSTSPSGATLIGTTTVTAASGVAVFSNLALSTVGSNYTLAISASGLPTIDTSDIDVVPDTITIDDAGVTTSDNLSIDFVDASDFQVDLNGTTTTYSTKNVGKLAYTAPTSVSSKLVFDDTSNSYTISQSLAAERLVASAGFEFDFAGATDLYAYTSGTSSITSQITAGTGNNYFVDASAAGYSYLFDPIKGIYSEIAGAGSMNVSGVSTTYAYVYSASGATFVAQPGLASLTVGSGLATFAGIPQVYLVGANDGTDHVTFDSAGGTFVGTPKFSYFDGTSGGVTYLVGALYAANISAQASTSGQDTAAFYSYPSDRFAGTTTASTLSGTTSNAAGSSYAFTIGTAGYDEASVFESGSATDTATLTSPGQGTLEATPLADSLRVGSMSITIDTFTTNSSGAMASVPGRVSVQGTSTDSATIDDAAGANALVAAGNSATWTSASGSVLIAGFGKVVANQMQGNDDTIHQQMIDFALSTTGNWKSA